MVGLMNYCHIALKDDFATESQEDISYCLCCKEPKCFLDMTKKEKHTFRNRVKMLEIYDLSKKHDVNEIASILLLDHKTVRRYIRKAISYYKDKYLVKV